MRYNPAYGWVALTCFQSSGSVAFHCFGPALVSRHDAEVPEHYGARLINCQPPRKCPIRSWGVSTPYPAPVRPVLPSHGPAFQPGIGTPPVMAEGAVRSRGRGGKIFSCFGVPLDRKNGTRGRNGTGRSMRINHPTNTTASIRGLPLEKATN